MVKMQQSGILQEKKSKKKRKKMRGSAIIGGQAADNGRVVGDFYPTPPNGTYPLLLVEEFPGPVWEPACGDGAIARILERDGGYPVCSTDLYDRGYGRAGLDFYQFSEPPEGCRSIVTNPPFRTITPDGSVRPVQDWAKFAMIDLGIEKMALFLKTTALAGKARSEVWKDPKVGLTKVYQLTSRVTTLRNGVAKPGPDGKINSGLIDYAWYIFERGYQGRPTLDWIDPINYSEFLAKRAGWKQAALLGDPDE